MSDPTIGFIGVGKLGNALAMALHARGYPVAAVASRSPESAQRLAARVPGCRCMAASDVAGACDLVFLTTPDDAIGPLVSSLRWRPGQGVVHCSGATSLEALQPATARGALPGLFHPLQTMACLETAEEAAGRLAGITYAVDGRGWVLELLEEAAMRLGGRAMRLRPEDQALYHASAVLACGYLTALLKAAADIWQEMGYTAREAREALAPLAAATVSSFGLVGPGESVTGPIARGDAATVARHLEALEERMPRLVPLACTLGLESLSISPEVDPESNRRLEQLLTGHLREGISRMQPTGTATESPEG